MAADLDDIRREIRALEKLIGALVVQSRDSTVDNRAAIASLGVKVDGLGAKLDAATAELRRLTDAQTALASRVAPIVESDEARGRALGKVFDRLTRLSIVQAASMVLGAFAVPVLVAGLALALTEPRAVLAVVLQVVSTATRSEPPPSTLPEDR